MLRVVARNLAENAIRYAGPGANATLSVRRSDGEVVLRVVDDGAGVDQADLARLFERFYRADRSRASRGTGLGLAIVKHVVTSAGGTVEAPVDVDGGSRSAARSPPARSPLTTLSPDLHHPEAPVPAGRWKTRRMTENTGRLSRIALLLGLLALLAAGCGRDDTTTPAARRRSAGGGSDLSGRIEADGSSTVGPYTTAAAERFQQENPDVQVTVGVSGTGGGFERFCRGETDLSNASRAIKDEEVTACEAEGHRVRRVPGGQRRAHSRREQGQRLGDVPDHGAAREDLGAGLQGEQLEPDRPILSGPGTLALRPRNRLRARSTTSPARSTARKARAAPTTTPARTTTRRSPASRARRAALATSASRTSRRTRTR